MFQIGPMRKKEKKESYNAIPPIEVKNGFIGIMSEKPEKSLKKRVCIIRNIRQINIILKKERLIIGIIPIDQNRCAEEDNTGEVNLETLQRSLREGFHNE